MSAVLLISLGGLFVMKRPDGQTWLSINDFTQTKFEVKQLSNEAITTIKSVFNEKSEATNKDIAVYRWQDEKGNWHFSDKPNEKTEKVVLDSTKITVLPSFKSDTKHTDIAKNKTESEFKVPTPTTIAPEKIKKLIKDANNIQNLMDSREKQISDSLNNN